MLKRIVKILIYLILSLFLLIVILAIIAAFSENKIARLALDQVGKTTNIPIEVEKIDFSLIRNFPLATIECNQLTVFAPENAGEFANDTLFHSGKLFISVDVKPLLHGFFDIRRVEFDQSKVFYEVDTSGYSNLDFLNDTTQHTEFDTTANTISINLKELKVTNLTCIYNDEKQLATANLKLQSLNISGHANNTSYAGAGEMKAILSDLRYPETNVHLMHETTLDFKGAYDNDSLKIDRVTVDIDDDARINASGKVAIADTLWANLLIQAEKLDLGQLAKYIPDSLFEEYGIRKASGILVADASIEGKLGSSELPAVDAAFRFSDGKIKYLDYPELSNISMQGEVNNGEKRTLADSYFAFRNLKFSTDSSHFTLSGSVNNLDRPEFKLHSNADINLKEAARFIPDSMVQNLSGRVQVEFSTKGVVPDSITDAYIQTMLDNSQLALNLQNIAAEKDSSIYVSQLNGTIDYKPNSIKLTGISGAADVPMIHINHFTVDANVTGNPLNMDSLAISFENLEAELDSSKFQISGNVRNLSKPEYFVKGEINLNLAEISQFIPDSLVNSVAGTVHSRFQSAATLNLDSISDQIMSIAMEKSSFDLDLQNITVTSNDSMMNVKNVTGALSYINDTFNIRSLSAEYMGMKTQMDNAIVTNAYAGAMQNQAVQINVHGNFYADKVDYDRLAIFMEEPSQTPSQEVSNEPSKYTYKINGRARVDELKYEKAIFKNIDTRFLVKENYYVIDSMTTNAFQGNATTSAKVEMLDSAQMVVWFKTNMHNMDVTQLVDAFGEYMDYDDIQKNNVQGTLSSVMDGKIVMKDFEPNYDEMLLKGDITLENGALFNVKPVMEVEQISGVGIKNLDSLYFSTLNSSLFLFRNNLYIPRTEIRTSSFDAMFLGMYSFGEDYAYHIRMFLGEVLSSKSKANLRKQAQAGGFDDEDEKDVTKGRTSIYVVSKSENGKEKAGFDNKHDRANMVARVNLQQQMVNLNFHPKLVTYNTED
ncbi:MAG TPA: AsmA family protein [Draconibacterium sp.]|nr:AsmA family protein [Draconibacterium sp.]